MSHRIASGWASATGRWLRMAGSRKIVVNALRISAVVGTLLNLINQWDLLRAGRWPELGHFLLNYCVPYCVSTYSATRIARDDSTPSTGSR